MTPPIVLSVSWCDVNRMRKYVVASALEAIARALREGTSDDEWSVVSHSGEAASSAEAQSVVFVDQKDSSVTQGPKVGLAAEELEQKVEKKGEAELFEKCVSKDSKVTASHVAYKVDRRSYVVLANPKTPSSLGYWEGENPETWRKLEQTGRRRPCSCGTRRSRVVQCRTPMCSERRW